MEQMPLRTPAKLEQDCLRLLRMNMTTREIERVDIVPSHPTEPTLIGKVDAHEIIASIAGRWALAD
jgi:hypothetical protein